MSSVIISSFFFFFNDTATTEIYTLSLHDALPISCKVHHQDARVGGAYKMSFTNFATGKSHSFGGTYVELAHNERIRYTEDRKSTRLNSSHLVISYAVFCLKKKN